MRWINKTNKEQTDAICILYLSLIQTVHCFQEVNSWQALIQFVPDSKTNQSVNIRSCDLQGSCLRVIAISTTSLIAKSIFLARSSFFVGFICFFAYVFLSNKKKHVDEHIYIQSKHGEKHDIAKKARTTDPAASKTRPNSFFFTHPNRCRSKCSIMKKIQDSNCLTVNLAVLSNSPWVFTVLKTCESLNNFLRSDWKLHKEIHKTFKSCMSKTLRKADSPHFFS